MRSHLKPVKLLIDKENQIKYTNDSQNKIEGIKSAGPSMIFCSIINWILKVSSEAQTTYSSSSAWSSARKEEG